MNNINQHQEGTVAKATKAIEQQTSKMPSDFFLWSAGGAIALSLVLKCLRKNHESLFVGHWVPTLLTLGVYNKLVKQFGSEQKERESNSQQ